MTSVLKSIFALLICYAFIPYGPVQQVLIERVLEVPFTYWPLLLLFSMLLVFGLLQGKSASLLIGPRPTFWLIIFLSVATVSTLVNYIDDNMRSPKSALIDLFSYFLYFVIAYCSSLIAMQSQNSIASGIKLISTLCKLVAVVVVVGITRHLALDMWFASPPFNNVFPPLPWRLFEALILVTFATLQAGVMFETRKRKDLFVLGILLAGVMFTESRTAYLAVFFLLVACIWVERKLVFFHPLVPISIGLTVMVVIAFFSSSIVERINSLDALRFYFSLDLEAAMREDVVARRLALIVGTMEIVKENPVLGIGPGRENYFAHFPAIYAFYHEGRPHNQYLMFAAATGLVGLFSFVWFCISIMLSGKRTMARLPAGFQGRRMLFAVIMLNFQILVLMFGYDLETQPFLWMLWGMSVGFIVLVQLEVKSRLQAQAVTRGARPFPYAVAGQHVRY